MKPLTALVLAGFIVSGCATPQIREPTATGRREPQPTEVAPSSSFDLRGVWDYTGSGERVTIEMKDGRYTVRSIVHRNDGEVYRMISDIQFKDGAYTWIYLAPSTDTTVTIRAFRRDGNTIQTEWSSRSSRFPSTSGTDTLQKYP